MNEKGYIAITISLILSLLLIAVTVSVGFTTWLSRFGSLDAISKQTSFYLAATCLEKAKLKLALDSSYAGNETFSIGTNSCTVYGITTRGNQKTIEARSAINGAATNLRIIVNTPQLTTSSSEEITHF